MKCNRVTWLKDDCSIPYELATSHFITITCPIAWRDAEYPAHNLTEGSEELKGSCEGRGRISNDHVHTAATGDGDEVHEDALKALSVHQARSSATNALHSTFVFKKIKNLKYWKLVAWTHT